MIVFGRKEREEIVITVPPSTQAREIVVVLTEVEQRRVTARIGIVADRDVTVDRREIHEARKAARTTNGVQQ